MRSGVQSPPRMPPSHLAPTKRFPHPWSEPVSAADARSGSVRLAEDPIARRFVDGQVIQMPAYENFLKPEEIHAVAAGVRWIHEGSWKGQSLLD